MDMRSGDLMKTLAVALSTLVLTIVTSCATGENAERQVELRDTSRCFDICGANFIACTQDPANDYSVCSTERNRCEIDCRAEKHDEERQQTEKKVVPDDELMREVSPDDGLSPKTIDEEVVDEPLEDIDEGVDEQPDDEGADVPDDG